MQPLQIQGTCEDSFSPIKEAFAANFEEGKETGAAVAVYVAGRPVVDLWAGYRDALKSQPWKKETIVNVYSVGKPMAAMCAMILVERGLLDLDKPVATYWPEFAQAGKAEVLVRWVLSHQAGLPAVRQSLETDVLYDWDRLTSILAAEELWWPPGTKHGEHALFYGHLVGELVRRVSNMSLGDFFRKEIAEPLNLSFAFGVNPEEEARVAETICTLEFQKEWDAPPDTLLYQAIHNPPGLTGSKVINSPEWRRSQIPAVNGHGNARAVAKFYGTIANGGELAGKQILQSKTIDMALTAQCSGIDEILQENRNWGLGFSLNEKGLFSQGGAGGSKGVGNTKHKVGYGYTTNQMGGFERHDRLIAAVESCLKEESI